MLPDQVMSTDKASRQNTNTARSDDEKRPALSTGQTNADNGSNCYYRPNAQR